MALINIPDVGLVNFPDDMSDAEIVSAIENDILPKYGPKKETPGPIKAGARGFARGIGELGITFGDVLPALAGKVVGAEKYAEEQLKEAEESRTKLEKKYPKAVESYKEVTPGTALSYGAERVGEALGSFVPTIALGGIGGAAARALGASAIRGVAAGAGAGSYAQAAPEIFESVYRETGKMAPGTALTFAFPAAALDAMVPAGVVSKLGRFGTLKAAEKSLADAGKLEAAKLIGMEAAETAVKEGLTEAAQESITIAAEQFEGSNKKFFDPTNIERLIESGISGAIAGGPLGGGAAYLQRRGEIKQQEEEQAAKERADRSSLVAEAAAKSRAERATAPFAKLGEAAAGELDKIGEAKQQAEATAAAEELAPTVSPITAYLKQQEELNKQRETQEEAQAAEQKKQAADIAVYEKEQAALETRGEAERAALLKKQEAESEAARVAQRKADVEAAIAAKKEEQAAAKITPPPYEVPQVLDAEFLKSALPAGKSGSINAILKKLDGALDLSDPAQYNRVQNELSDRMNNLSDKSKVYRDQLEALSNAIKVTYGPSTDRAVQPEAGQPPSVAGVGAPVQPAEAPPVGRPEGVGAGGVGVTEGITARDVSGPPAGEIAVGRAAVTPEQAVAEQPAPVQVAPEPSQVIAPTAAQPGVVGAEVTPTGAPPREALPQGAALESEAEALLFNKVFGDLPTEVVDNIRKGKTELALASLIDSTNSKTIRLVASRLLAQKQFLPTIRVDSIYSRAEKEAGIYYPDKHQVVLDKKYGLTERTFIHELVHGYTARLVYLLERNPSALNDTQRNALNNLKDLYNNISSRAEFQGDYGLKNIHEFISEAFSNRKFQDKLKQVKVSKVPTAPSLWTYFTRAVASLFGMDNALGRTMKEFDDLLMATPKLPRYQPALGSKPLPLANKLTAEEADLLTTYPTRDNTSAVQAIGAAVSNPKTFISEKATKFKIEVADHIAGLEEELKDLPIYDDLGQFRGDIQMRHARRANSLAVQSYEHGPIAFQKGVLIVQDGPSPAKARQRVVDEANSIGVDKSTLLKLFHTYMLARRDKSLMEKYETDQVNAQLVLSDPNAEESDKNAAREQLKEAPKRSNLTDDQVQAALDLESKYPSFSVAAQMWADYNAANVDAYLQAGIITADKAQEWLDNVTYVPFYRVMDEADGKPGYIPQLTGRMQALPKFKKLKGSEREVEDVFENMLQNTIFATSITAGNMSARNSVRTLEAMGKAREIREGEEGGNVTVYENGKPVRFEVDDPYVRAAFDGVDNNVPNFIRVIGIPTNVLRKTVTLNPVFQFYQLFKDSFSAWGTSGHKGFPPIYNAYKDYLTALTKGPTKEQQELMRRGTVTGINYTGTDEDTKNAIRAAAGSPNWFNKLMSALEYNASLVDASVRAQVYKRALQAGDDPSTAAYKASQVLDYSARGRSGMVAIARQLVPFINPQIQSMRMLYQAATATGGLTREDRARIQSEFYKRAAMIAAMTVMYTLAMSDDEEYQNVRDEVRDNFWFVPGVGPDNRMLRIPIPFEFGLIFKTIPERLTMLALGQDTTGELKDSMIRILSRMFLVNPLPQGLLPAVEATANYSFFRNAPIVGEGLAKKEPAAQYSSYTSETAKALGELLNISPLKIDYLTTSYLSQIGTAVLFATDAIVGTLGEKPAEKPTQHIERLPFIGGLFQRPDDSGKLQNYYKLREQVEAAAQTYKKYAEESPEKAREYREEKRGLLTIRPAINAMQERLEAIRAREKYIRASDRTPDEKQTALDELQKKRIDLMRNLQRLEERAGVR